MLLIIFLYLLYLTLLYLLLIIPKKIRLIYIDIISLLLLTCGNTEIKTFILLNLFHKYAILLIKIHKINIIKLFDSIYYILILYICYFHIQNNINMVLIIMSNMFLLFCFINILFSILNIRNQYIYIIHKYSSISQTISVGYFINTMLWYNNDYSTFGFTLTTLLWIYLMSFSWYIYICSEESFYLSINYKYINEILLIAICIAFINSIIFI